MKSLFLTFLFCTIAAFALPLRVAAEANDAPTSAASDEAQGSDSEAVVWTKKLDDAKMRLDLAQRQVDQLGNAKGKGAARRYPRGDAKEKYLDQLAAARDEYDAAQRALPDVIDEARRAGIPPGQLEPYEAAAEAAAPAANADDDASEDLGDEEVIEEESDAEPASD